MKKILLIGIATALVASESLPLITVKAQEENPQTLESKVDISDLDFASTLKRFSGFFQSSATQLGTIEGAPSRFTALSWEGIHIADSSAIDRQPTLVNHLLLSSSSVSITQGAVSSIYGAGGSGLVQISQRLDDKSQVALGASSEKDRFLGARVQIKSDKLKGYIAAENRYKAGFTAYSKEAGKLDTSSEKDSTTSTSCRGVIVGKINDEINATIKVLDSKAKEKYDGTDPITYAYLPNDRDSYWDHSLTAKALEINRADQAGFYQKIALHRTEIIREDHSSFAAKYESVTDKIYAEAGKKWSFLDIKFGAENAQESGKISGQMDTEATQNSYYTNAKIKLENGVFSQLAFRNTLYESDLGGEVNADCYYALVGYEITPDQTKFSIGVSSARSINMPSLYQLINPWGSSNFDLKHEKLNQTRVFASAKNELFGVTLTGFETKIKNYINWINATSEYENVDEVEFKGAKAFVEFTPSDELAIYADYTHTFDHKSSADSLKNRQPSKIIASGFVYDTGIFTVGYDIKATNSYQDGTHKLKGSIDDTLRAGYKTADHATIELAVKNLSDTYREKAYGYTPETPKRTLFVSLKQEF